MLILTRRPRETITIGNDITVTVIGIRGNQVKLGIAAPSEVPVHQAEVYERIQRGKLVEERKATAAVCGKER